MRMGMVRTLHTITFKDGDCYIASGVEMDIAAQGSSEQEALRRLDVALRAEISEANAIGRDVFAIGPAPEIIQNLYHSQNNKVVSRDMLKVA